MPVDERILTVPPINPFDGTYFMQHQQDIQILLDHLQYYRIDMPMSRTVVLEIGAGAGMHTGFLARHFGRVVATDIFRYSALMDGTFLAHLASEYQRQGYPFDLAQVDFLCSDAMDLILRNGFADLAVSINTFEHISEPERALAELVRCVKRGGYIYIQFDPIWTADTGSHFPQYVQEPWAHLLLSTEEFFERMVRAGATEYERGSFLHGINRKRLNYYRSMLESGVHDGRYTIVHQTAPQDWSGVSTPENLNHPFLQKALAQGYTHEELMLRGMRWILRVTE